jgi:hypothetical protein
LEGQTLFGVLFESEFEELDEVVGDLPLDQRFDGLRGDVVALEEHGVFIRNDRLGFLVSLEVFLHFRGLQRCDVLGQSFEEDESDG